MAIKRKIVEKITYEEIDNTVDRQSPTGIPGEASRDKELLLDKGETTDLPAYDSTEGNRPPFRDGLKPPSIGRTFADLIYDFINNTRVMATILMFLPFPFSKIDSMTSLLYPTTTGLILNTVYFVIWPAISKATKWYYKN